MRNKLNSKCFSLYFLKQFGESNMVVTDYPGPEVKFLIDHRFGPVREGEL